MKYKVGTWVKSYGRTYVGIIISVDRKNINPYTIQWCMDYSISSSVNTSHPKSYISHLTIEDKRKLATKNKLCDFKVGQKFEVCSIHKLKGTVGTIKRIAPFGDTKYVETDLSWSGYSSPWHINYLFIHKINLKESTTLVDSSADLKRDSLERKDTNMTVSSKATKTARFGKKTASKKVAKKFGKKTSKKKEGYVVRALMKNGAAKKAGIVAGDVITSVAGRSIRANGALGRVLKGYKKGAKVSVTVIRLDGRNVFLRNVVLGANASGRASLGVISGKKKASAYNTKQVDGIKEIVKDTKALTKKVLAEVPENEFMKRAREEMEGVGALMADMKGRDALLKARNLKRTLHAELRGGLADNTTLVNDYLNRLKNSSEVKPEDEKKTKRTLSLKGRVFFGLLSLAAIGSGAAWLTSFYGLLG